MRVNLQNIYIDICEGIGWQSEKSVHALFDQMVLILQLTCLTFMSTVVNANTHTQKQRKRKRQQQQQERTDTNSLGHNWKSEGRTK